MEVRQIGWEGDTCVTRWVPATVIRVDPEAIQVRLEDGRTIMGLVKTSPRWRPATARRTP